MNAARLVPAGLLLLGAVPVLAGGIRVAGLALGDVPAADVRFTAAPVPVLVHIVGATVFTMLGALQFGRRRSWHRPAGRVLVPCGIAAALSGLWMAHFTDLPDHDGVLLLVFRTVFGAGMAVALVLGVTAIGRGDVARHGAWMTRAYAIGIGAGTQFVVTLVWTAAVGEPGELSRALLMGGAWVINLLVAEAVISARSSHRPSRVTHP